jgi:hypothetical protein
VRARTQLADHLEKKGLLDVGLQKLLRRGPVAVAAAVAIFFVLMYSPRLRSFLRDPFGPNADPMAHRDDHPAEKEAPDLPATPERIDEATRDIFTDTRAKREEAYVELIHAETDYRHRRWRSCVQKLDEVEKLDPATTYPILKLLCQSGESTDFNSKRGW